MQEKTKMKVHLISGFMFFSSVEVNNFLKIDENQNEEAENDQPSDSPVSRSCCVKKRCDSDSLSSVATYLYVSPLHIFQKCLHSRSSLAEETQ